MHESGKPGVTEQTVDMDDSKATHTQPCQHAIVTSQNAQHLTTTPASPTMEAAPPEGKNSEMESLIHTYSCLKLAFIVKMAFLQNIDALIHNPSDEDVKREEQAMEEARAQAIEAWEQIRNKGVPYDVQGLEYLRSRTHPTIRQELRAQDDSAQSN